MAEYVSSLMPFLVPSNHLDPTSAKPAAGHHALPFCQENLLSSVHIIPKALKYCDAGHIIAAHSTGMSDQDGRYPLLKATAPSNSNAAPPPVLPCSVARYLRLSIPGPFFVSDSYTADGKRTLTKVKLDQGTAKIFYVISVGNSQADTMGVNRVFSSRQRHPPVAGHHGRRITFRELACFPPSHHCQKSPVWPLFLPQAR